MNPSTTLPSRNAYTAGIDCTWNALEIWGFSSTLTFTSVTAPSVASTTFSMMGPSVRHGPHQGAHKSTTTGTSLERSMTSVWNVASVTSVAITKEATGEVGRSRPVASRAWST